MPDTPSVSPAPESAPISVPSQRKRRWPRILLFTVAGLLLVLVVAAGVSVVWLRAVARAALPQLDGDAHFAGLSAPVTVRRDGHGVPHIEAATEDDLFAAQGYVTAQDRLWQMDGLRRSSYGELAEVMGPSMLKHDKMQRVLQMRVTAERIYAQLPAADRARLDDYARGVNLYIAHCAQTNSFPVEFRLLGYRPRPWKGVDSVSVGLTMVQGLDMHAWDKLKRAHIAAKLNNPKLESDLYPVGSWRDHAPTGIRVDLSQPQPKQQPENEDDDENTEARFALPAGAEDAENLALNNLADRPICGDCANGSNNWVVAGTRTATGKPLLANDMHLELTVPNIWYIADLRAPGYHAAGVTLPGLPFVIAGHNEHVAWGFTALYADVQDLYTEKLDGKGNYEGDDGQWHPLAVDHETIAVRGQGNVVVDVQSTEHGPLVNPVLTTNDPPLALKWTIYDPALNTLPLYELNTASNWTEFSAALTVWSWPTQNLVYSDDQGHVAYHAIGKVPIRGGGIGLADKPLPPGNQDPRSVWGYAACAGICPTYIPYDQLPNAVDPPSGFVATANSRVTTDKSLFPISDEWVSPYRTERIYKMLDGRGGLTANDMLAAQTDIYSEVDQEMGHRFAYAIDHTPGPEGNGDPRMRQAAGLMRGWDGRLTAGSAAASLVAQARAALYPMILEPKLGKLADEYQWAESGFAEEEIVMYAKPEWLPKNYKNWDELLTAAVRRGMREGKAPADVTKWAYGSWHVVDLEHPLARFLPWVGRVAGTGALPLSGDGSTVKASHTTHGPSQRFIMDWSNVDGSTENIVLGESGNPLSPYFRDQWNDWYNGTTFPLPFTPAAVAAHTQHTLRLEP
jgi:penicillin amidase